MAEANLNDNAASLANVEFEESDDVRIRMLMTNLLYYSHPTFILLIDISQLARRVTGRSSQLSIFVLMNWI